MPYALVRSLGRTYKSLVNSVHFGFSYGYFQSQTGWSFTKSVKLKIINWLMNTILKQMMKHVRSLNWATNLSLIHSLSLKLIVLKLIFQFSQIYPFIHCQFWLIKFDKFPVLVSILKPFLWILILLTNHNSLDYWVDFLQNILICLNLRFLLPMPVYHEASQRERERE